MKQLGAFGRILVEVLQAAQNLRYVVSSLGVEDDSRHIHFANVHLIILHHSHRLPPKVRLIGSFRDGYCNAYGLQTPGHSGTE